MPNPQYTVATEVADLAARGAMTIAEARKRMHQLGLNGEQTETLLARALDPNQRAFGTGHSSLETACRALLMAWDGANEMMLPKAHADAEAVLEALNPSITLIRRLIGEEKR